MLARAPLVRSLPVLVIGLALLVAGCRSGESGIKTYPVKGKVVYKDGTPFSGGSINFHSLDKEEKKGPEIVTNGGIGPDGSFTLQTVIVQSGKSKKHAGAPEGKYSVTVLRLDGKREERFNLPGPYTVGPQDNDITVTVPTR